MRTRSSASAKSPSNVAPRHSRRGHVSAASAFRCAVLPAGLFAMLAAFLILPLPGSLLAAETVTVDAQVASSADDAHDVVAGWPGYSQTETVVYAGAPGGAGPATGGWRWAGLDIPAGATVNAAYAEINQSAWGYPVATTLALENAAAPGTFSATSTPAQRWGNRTTFTAGWTWPRQSPGAWIRTPDLAAGVQELVNKRGRLSSLVLLENGTGVTQGQYHGWTSFDSGAGARLHIEYTTGPDTTPPVRSNGQPSGTLASGTTGADLSLATNEKATCRYGTVPNVAYGAIANAFATTGGTSHSTPVTGLTPGAYTYYVRCQDPAGNASTDDFLISFSVPADTVSPVRSGGQPTGVLSAGTTSATLSLATDESATCRYSTTAGVAYGSMTNTFTTTGGTAHSRTVTGLTNGTTYSYYVRCRDTAGNTNTDDYQIAFKVGSPGPATIDAVVTGSANDAYEAIGGWPGYSQTDTVVYAGAISGRNVRGGWRWSVAIPSGAVITTAYVELTQAGWGTAIPTTLALENAPAPAAFSDASSPAGRWANRTAWSASWTWPKQSPGAKIRTPGLAAGIQELVNKNGSLSAIVLLEDGATARDYHSWESYESSPAKAARLHIEYTTGAAPTDDTPPFRRSGVPSATLFAPMYPAGTTQVTIGLDTDEAATCRYAAAPDIAYGSMPSAFTSTGAKTHRTNVTGLTNNREYRYYVRCQDAADNVNGGDLVIRFRVLSPQETSDRTGKPWSLEFTSGPQNAASGGTLPSVRVTVRDFLGNTAAVAIPITVKLANNKTGAVLSGVTTVTSVNGVAAFGNLSVNKPGAYSLVASAPMKLIGRWDGGGRYGTVSAEGNYAYVGHIWEPGGADVIDVSDPTNPTFVSNWGANHDEHHEGGQVQNGIGYFSSENGWGATIVDFSDPAAPRELARLTAANGASDYVHNTFIDGHYLYVVSNRGPNVPVFDVSDPAHPVKVRTITSPTGLEVHDVAAGNGRAYFLEMTGGAVHVFDVSDLERGAPYLGTFTTGSYSHTGTWTEDFRSFLVNRETLGPGGTADIFDVTDPSNAPRIAQINPVQAGMGDTWPMGPQLIRNILYYAWGTNGFTLFEMTDPSDPVLLERYDTDGGEATFGAFETYPFLGPDKALVTDEGRGLYVFDTTPSATRSAKFTIS